MLVLEKLSGWETIGFALGELSGGGTTTFGETAWSGPGLITRGAFGAVKRHQSRDHNRGPSRVGVHEQRQTQRGTRADAARHGRCKRGTPGYGLRPGRGRNRSGCVGAGEGIGVLECRVTERARCPGGRVCVAAGVGVVGAHGVFLGVVAALDGPLSQVGALTPRPSHTFPKRIFVCPVRSPASVREMPVICGVSACRRARSLTVTVQRICARPRCSTASRFAAMSSPVAVFIHWVADSASIARPSAVAASSMR